jgi:antitoxin (DNA-binding transcriptional repressor) of toxin-antitoxin stability system
MKVSVLEAKERLPELIRAAQAGEEVIILGVEQIQVRLAPISPEPDTRHPVGSAARILEGLKRPKPPGWRQRSDAEIQDTISELREGWD